MSTFKWSLDLKLIKIGYAKAGLRPSEESMWRHLGGRVYIIF